MAKVYFGSVAVTKPSAPSTLPGKLQRILRKAISRNCAPVTGCPSKCTSEADSAIRPCTPLLVRMVTGAGQGRRAESRLSLTDICETVAEAHLHGYTQETVGCPIVAAGGVFNSHVVEKDAGYLTYDKAEIFGLIAEAKCLINLSHVKGHGVCAYGGACKNIAMGCVNGADQKQDSCASGRDRLERGPVCFLREVCGGVRPPCNQHRPEEEGASH